MRAGRFICYDLIVNDFKPSRRFDDDQLPTEVLPAARRQGPEHGDGAREALRSAWRKLGGLAGILVTSAPTVVFVVVSAFSELTVAIVAAAVAAVGAFTYKLARREPLGGAIGGLVLAMLCALVAALTGEARGFFLLPTALPAVVVLICVGTVLARRPLTGLMLNRVAGGPSTWRRHRALMRIYNVTTLIAVVINLVNFALQAFFYAADQPVILAFAHAATGPIFATLVAATLVAVRRRLARERSGASSTRTSTHTEQNMPDALSARVHNSDDIVVISTFVVAPGNQAELARVLSDASHRVLRTQRGFLASTIYSSVDGTRVVNYARWSSPDALEAMLRNPACRAHLPWVRTVATVEPARYVTTSIHTPPGPRLAIPTP
jgi:hypothetical protein